MVSDIYSLGKAACLLGISSRNSGILSKTWSSVAITLSIRLWLYYVSCSIFLMHLQQHVMNKYNKNIKMYLKFLLFKAHSYFYCDPNQYWLCKWDFFQLSDLHQWEK